MTRHARIDQNGILLEWGLSDYGGQGIPVDDSFTFAPGTRQWNGASWLIVIPPSSTLAQAIDAAIANPTLALIKAVFQAWRQQVS